MKYILSTFLEDFNGWKEKVTKQQNPFLDEIVNNISSVIFDEKTNVTNKAKKIVNIVQNIDTNYFPFLFDYSNTELTLIGEYYNTEQVTVKLYNDFVNDLHQYNYVNNDSDNQRVLLNKYEYQPDDSDYSETEANIGNSNSDDTLEIIVSNLKEYNDMAIVDDWKLKTIDYETNKKVLHIVVGTYMLYYIENDGWNFIEIPSYKYIDDLFDLITEYTVDTKFTDYLLSEFNFDNTSEYENLYGIIVEYIKDSNKIVFDDLILDEQKIATTLSHTEKIYIRGICIVNKLYDLESDIVDGELFPKDYPWNESFDDMMSSLFYYFNRIVVKYPSIIDIDKVNEEHHRISDEYSNKNLSELILDFKEAIKNYTEFDLDIYKTENIWLTIYRNEEFKELLEKLHYSFNITDNAIAKFFRTQSTINYQQFEETED